MPGKHKTGQCLHCHARTRSDNLSRHVARRHQGKGIKRCPDSDIDSEREVEQNDIIKTDKDIGLDNFKLIKLADYLHLPDFRGVFMRDTLPTEPNEKECGIVNLDTSSQPDSHWTAYYKDGAKRIYFDSFGQITPIEVQKYLKAKDEFANDDAVIQRNNGEYFRCSCWKARATRATRISRTTWKERRTREAR